MKKITILFFCCFSILTTAQIKGRITNSKKEPLSFVNIYLENSITGTTSNENGFYELPLKKTGEYTVVFQFLGYKTSTQKVTITSFPFVLDTHLIEEKIILNEVSINSKENPANKIIRSVIANKEKNTNKLSQFTADFYSRGLFKTKNAPKRILGQKLGDLGGGLDSTRSGIMYLSETISQISAQKKPHNFKEHIVASKVSGRDNGISFNQAKQVNFNFYDNQIQIFDANLFSPISNYAFNYYHYKLEGVFYDKNGKLINKIKIIPKRENDRVFGGFIYIVEDDWTIYGTDVTVTGEQINNPAIDVLHLKQDYNYSKSNDLWVLISQTIDFKVGMLGFNMNGRFSSTYSNYNFSPNFNKKTFGNEILSFEKEATKKDSVYWNKLRPVPLTVEESKDYIVKDSIKIVRKSKKYLDSIDSKQNKLSLLTPLLGYTYRNSYKKWQFSIGSPLEKLRFNTVEGFNTSLAGRYFKRLNDEGKWYRIKADFKYGFSDKKVRPSANFTYKWDNIDKPILEISGGVTTNQFNSREPISKLYNSISSLFFERNYAKIYEKSFAKIAYSKDIFNGIRLQSSLEYANRKPLVNTTDYSFVDRDNVSYTPNDPQNLLNFSPSFTSHDIFTAAVGATINFGNKFMSYPNGKFNVGTKKYPKLFVGYRKIVGLGDSNLNSDLITMRINQDISLGSIGEFKYNIRSGLFLKKKNISFIDYAHFNGNKFLISPSYYNYTNHFNLLDYYALSTNDKYTELHIEHNFKGYILGKIPLINKLNFHLVGGAKSLFTADRKPYTEYSIGIDNIGWKKWRFLRLDYVRSNFNGVKKDGFVIGVSLLD